MSTSHSLNGSDYCLSAEQKLAAYNRFGETDETRKVKLLELRNLVQQLPYHTLFESNNANNLINYLRGQQFDVKRAAKVIENFIHFSIKYPHWCHNLRPEEFSGFKSVVHILKTRDKFNRVVVFCKPSNFVEMCTPAFVEKNPHVVIRFNIYVNQQLSCIPDAQIFGVVIVYSYSGVKTWNSKTFKAIAPFSQRLKQINYQQNCSAIKIDSVYFFEEPFYARWVWNIAKPVLPARLRNKLHFCDENFSVFHEIFEKDKIHELPYLVGGDFDIMRYSKAEQKLDAYNRFGETDETRKMKLIELRNLVQQLPYHTLFDSNNANNLIKYLRGQQFDVKRAAKVIENFIHFSIKYPHWCHNLRTEEFSVFKSVVHILKTRDKFNRVVVFCKPSNFVEMCTPTFVEKNPHVVIRFNIYVNQQLSCIPDAQIFGVVIVYSYSGVKTWNSKTFKAIAPFSQRLKQINYQQNCSAIKIDSVYFFEEPFYARWLWNIAKPVLPARFRNKLHFCDENFSVFHEIFEKDKIHELPYLVGGDFDIMRYSKGRSFLENHNRTGDEESEEHKYSAPTFSHTALTAERLLPDLVPDALPDGFPDRVDPLDESVQLAVRIQRYRAQTGFVGGTVGQNLNNNDIVPDDMQQHNIEHNIQHNNFNNNNAHIAHNVNNIGPVARAMSPPVNLRSIFGHNNRNNNRVVPTTGTMN